MARLTAILIIIGGGTLILWGAFEVHREPEPDRWDVGIWSVEPGAQDAAIEAVAAEAGWSRADAERLLRRLPARIGTGLTKEDALAMEKRLCRRASMEVVCSYPSDG